MTSQFWTYHGKYYFCKARMTKSTKKWSKLRFKTTISSWFAKRLSHGKRYHQCSLLIIALNLSDPQNVGSLLIIAVKLYSYKDINVWNIRAINYFDNYYRPSRKAWNTIKLAILHSLAKLQKDVIYTYVSPFSILFIWYWIWPVKEYGSRRLKWYDSLREESLVFNARTIFCLLMFFCWNGFLHKKNQPYALCSLLQSLKPPPPQVHHEITCCHN